MQVSVETTQNLERRMTVALPADQIEKQINERLADLKHKVRLDGFRPGKVPMSVIKKRFEPGVRQDVINDLLQSSLPQALDQEELRPAAMPDVKFNDIKDGEDVSYVATFEVLPEIDLSIAEKLELQRPAAEIADSDIDAVIERLRKQKAEWTEVDRACADSDKVVIDFVGTLDGEKFEGGSAEGHELVLGDGQMLEDFENGIIGAKAGETRTVPVNFPEDYHADLAGKEASFEITVKSVNEATLPEVTDEFAAEVGNQDATVEGLRNDIKLNLERERDQAIQTKMKNKILDQLSEIVEIDIPNILIDEEIKRLQQQEASRSPQTDTVDQPEADRFEKEARKRVSLSLILGEVIRQNQIKVDKNKVNEMIARMAMSYENPQQIIQYYTSNPKMMESLEAMVLEDQVVDWLVDQAKVTDIEMSFNDLAGF